MIAPVSELAMRASGDVAGAGSVGSASASRGVAASTAAKTDFSSLLGEAVADLAHKLADAEAVSLAGVKGTASMQQVVETVMATEQSLQAAIAIRDKIVSAYLEIGRMAI